MHNLQRAWFLFLGLGLLTLILSGLIGQPPAGLTSTVALPHNLLHRVGTNLRLASETLADRSDLRQALAEANSTINELERQNRDLSLSVGQLSEALQIQADQSPGVALTAPVTGLSSSTLLSRLTLGKGSTDGVMTSMVVTVPQGLVGMVVDVTGGNSVVRSVVDPQSRVGITVRGRGGQGVALGLPDGNIRVTDFIEVDEILVGDVVETSSIGGLYPRGVMVGTVVEVPPRDLNELRRTFTVEPVVDLSTLLEVALISPQ